VTGKWGANSESLRGDRVGKGGKKKTEGKVQVKLGKQLQQDVAD